jgi:hypothetical protein
VARSAFSLFGSLAVVLAFVVPGKAAPPSESLLPATTKGFISTPDVDEVRTRFKQTQLGELVNDPVMKPFIDDLKKQIGEKLERAGKKLGLKWDDMEGVYGGEVTLALVQPDAKDKLSHATVLIVDITGKRAAADAMLAKVDANQKANRGVRSALKAAGVDMVVYTQPLAAGAKTPEKAFYFIKDEVLVATDHEIVAKEIAGRFGGDGTGSLASHAAFKATMQRNKKAAGGLRHNVRWFVEPFGYAEVSRAMQAGRRKRGSDPIKILRDQGFSAIQGLGGNVNFATGSEEVLHHTFIFAPAVDGKPGVAAKDKYHLAMRMLDFPNSARPTDLDPQPWVLPDVASYLTFNWKVKDAFEFSATLVDAFLGESGTFKEVWDNLKIDPNGPMIDIRKELIDLLGERVTLLSDVKVPVDLKSERLMVLAEVTRPEIVAKTLEKAFKDDPTAKKRVIGGQVIWELTQEEGIAEDTELMIEGAGFVSKDEAKAEEEAEEEDADDRVLPNLALTVHKGHLIVSTHVEYVAEFIERDKAGAAGLAKSPDFVRVDAAIKRLGSASDSFRFFTRTDEAYRATYELVKQNKLPQAETLLAHLLNALVSSKEEGAGRKQSIDGSKLPAYDLVKKYFGPGGFYVQSEKDGWLVVGCLLNKNAK